MNSKPDSKVLIQGITEPFAAIHTAKMKAYGTQIVAGVSPGQGGQTIEDIPVFDLVEQALSVTGSVDTSIIFVPAYQVLDAALEAIAAGIRQIILITGKIPPLDLVRLWQKADATQTLILGPNSSGIIVPGKMLLGTHPSEFYTPGSVGLISRSSTLTYEIALELTQAELGQSISISLGSDTMVGASFSQWLPILNEDKHTKAIVLIGESDSSRKEFAIQYIKETVTKPLIAYIAGRYTPGIKPQRHASDLIASQPALEAESDATRTLISAFEKDKIPVAESLAKITEFLKKAVKK